MTKSPEKFRFVLVFLFAQLLSLAQPQTGSSEEEPLKNTAETKFVEVIYTDSMPGSFLMKRAVDWIKAENPKYRKLGGVTSGNKAECTVSFPVKPKTLNPTVDYTGKITMQVIIECKDSRYRYTVSDIRHISKSGQTSAGSIDNKVPECGSMTMDEVVWKKLKAEALRNASMVVLDIREGMAFGAAETASEEW